MLKRTSFMQWKLLKTCKYLSTNAELKQTDSFRTIENNPLDHSRDHLGKFYCMSTETKKKIFGNGGLPKAFEVHIKTFAENCIMVREPALDIISCMKTLDFTKPAVRFVLYGKHGNGKTLSLAHVMHYAYDSGFLIVHVPWVANWMRRCKESSNSISKEGFTDLPLDSAVWLVNFKNQNYHILNNADLRVSQDYVWSKREITQKDAPILELIDHGINRVKYASDCVVALAEEIKKFTIDGKLKTFVAIDGFNSFFSNRTRIYTEKKEMVLPKNITITEAFINLTKFDWCNAVIVLTVDELAVPTEDRKSHFPKYLLGRKGFEHLDPFVPVHVPGYSEIELTSVMNYFRERRWVQTQPENDIELALLSAFNPFRLMEICAPL